MSASELSDLRCLSLHQPWASLVAEHVKTIIDRDTPTKHRGRIGLASTKRRPLFADMKHLVGDLAWNEWYAAGLVSADGETDNAPLGALVATANLVDCVSITCEPRVDRLCRAPDREELTLYRVTSAPGEPATSTYEDHSDQLPYGDFTPGRWAWLLDDVRATTERCPACWSEENNRCDDPLCEHCDTCDGAGGCEPIPVKGHQGLWTWSRDVGGVA